MRKEGENLLNTSLIDLIKYIKSSIDTIVLIKVEDELESFYNSFQENENAASQYETLLRKLESSLRQHIAYEHQLKIEYEKTLNKLENIENEKNELLETIEAQKLKYEKIKTKIENYKSKINLMSEEKDKMAQNEKAYKEQIDSKQKEIIKLQIKLKTSSSTLNNNKSNSNIYWKSKSKSNLSKSNSSINFRKDDLIENNTNNNNNVISCGNNSENNFLFAGGGNVGAPIAGGGCLYNKFRILKRNKMNVKNVSLCNSTISFNMNNKNKSKSKSKSKSHSKSQNNIPKKRRKVLSNSVNKNKSMSDFFPSRNISYLIKEYNNNFINKYLINRGNKRQTTNFSSNNFKTNSLNITNNTFNMNKNHVMINLNTNIINANNTPIEKYKVQQKLIEYKKLINKKLMEISKAQNRAKNRQKNLSTLINNKNYSKNYSSSNKIINCNNIVRKHKYHQHRTNNSPNYHKIKANSNSRSNKTIIIKKNYEKYKANIKDFSNKLINVKQRIKNQKNNNKKGNERRSRSSSSNSKSNSFKKVKNKNVPKPTLKSFAFIKYGSNNIINNTLTKY